MIGQWSEEYARFMDDQTEYLEEPYSFLPELMAEGVAGFLAVMMLMVTMDKESRAKMTRQFFRIVKYIPVLIPFLFYIIIKEEHVLPIIWKIKRNRRKYEEAPVYNQPIINEQNRLIVLLNVLAMVLVLAIIIWLFYQIQIRK